MRLNPGLRNVLEVVGGLALFAFWLAWWILMGVACGR